MTKKRFGAFARTIAIMKNRRDAAMMAKVCLAIFSADNPRFDSDRFLTACGLQAVKSK